MNAPVSLPVLFACTPLGTRLTRSSCGKRHLAASGELTGRGYVVRDETCRACPIGAAHAKGEEPTRWPDGAPVALVSSLGTAQPPASKPNAAVEIQRSMKPSTKHARPIAAPKEQPMTDSKNAKLYTYAGKSLTLTAWAAQLGVTDAALRMRIKKGWPIAKVLSTKSLNAEASGAAGAAIQRGVSKKRALEAAARAGTTLVTPHVARAPAISVDAAPTRRVGKARKLPRPIEPDFELASNGRMIATPRAALEALGYRIVETLDTPRGLALIVEAP